MNNVSEYRWRHLFVFYYNFVLSHSHSTWLTLLARSEFLYFLIPACRCAAFTCAWQDYYRWLKSRNHHFTSDPVTMLDCYVIIWCDLIMWRVPDCYFLACCSGTIFQALFLSIIWRMACYRSTWSDRMSCCRDSMTTVVLQSLSHNCELVRCQLFINFYIKDISLARLYGDSVAFTFVCNIINPDAAWCEFCAW